MKVGRKGIEPSITIVIEFTAQPVIPSNGTFLIKPGEKFEFSFLMHEINVLTNWTILAYYLDEYPGSNREPTVPHSAVLPIELHSPI